MLKDLELDAYLKAQIAFDAEVIRALRNKPSESALGALRGLYNLHDVLDREVARARHGRGMAALDALIMLESSRLRGARWTDQPPSKIDPIAEALSRLKETRGRWEQGKTDLQPLYALTRLGPDGKRTWSVEKWMTADEVNAAAVKPEDPSAGEPGRIIKRDGGFFIDRPKEGTAKYELVGGADAAAAAHDAVNTGYKNNRSLAALQEKMKTADFVAPGALDQTADGWDFAAVFGPGGLHSQGRVFFFEARTDNKPAVALHPLDALSRPPEEVVMKVYLGDKALRRDRFPTLKSLEASDEAGAFKTMTVSPKGAAALASNASDLKQWETRRGWIEVKLNSFGFARDEKGQVAQLYRTKDDFEAQWKAYDHAARDLESARKDLATATAEEEARKADADKAKTAADEESANYLGAQKRLRLALYDAMVREERRDPSSVSFKSELDRRVAEPRFSASPTIKDDGLRAEAKDAHEKYKDEMKTMDAAAKVYTEAAEKLKLAQARTVNAGKAVRDGELTLARSGKWTLHRTSDLTLGLDSQNNLVNVAAPAARGTEQFAHLDESLKAPAVTTVSGDLLAAVVDEKGRLRSYYTNDDGVDAAFKTWTLRSYRAGGDAVGADGDEALTKVRYSNFEETVDGKAMPVTLGENYLIDRLSGAQSALWKAKHWAYLPFNWGNILLEIPRGVAGIPAEFAGRNQSANHYLGRAYMYKTEGGSTEHHGLFRSVLGAVDVLNLLPDPADRFYDPSQFPDVVRTDSAIRPGEGLWSKDLTSGPKDDLKDIHLGRQALAREATHAAEDLEAARVRTLARFHGGVEQITLETRRGRAGWYQESTRTAEAGPEAVSRTLQKSDIGSDPNSDGRGPAGRDGDVVTSATPGHLFVDQVERRVRVIPGADAYGRQAAAYDGYDARVAARGAGLDKQGQDLAAELATAKTKIDEALSARGQARTDLESVRERWSRLSQRIGEQLELEKRMAELQNEIKALEGRIAFWNNYERLLIEARRGGGVGPVDPNDPSNPWHRAPWGPNPMSWAWALALFFLSAIAAAFWHALRRRRTPLRPL